MRIVTSGLLLSLTLIGTAAVVKAQPNASEPATVSQVVDGTKVTVAYSRPVARGRRGLFGTEVPIGHTWTPGANESTTIAASKDVSINGHPVPKGKYSVWMVINTGDWELVLDPDTTLYHTQGPKVRPGQIRFLIPREHHAFTEVLTWSFPNVSSSRMTLAMQWDTVSVPLEIKVIPTFTDVVPTDAGQRVAGTYHWRWSPALADPAPAKDTTLRGYPGMKSADATFTLRYAGGKLEGTLDPPAWGDAGWGDYALIQKKGDLYTLGRIDRGELIEIMDYWVMQFTVANGHATGFELRTPDDALEASGKIAP